jgi:hypothetical protein
MKPFPCGGRRFAAPWCTRLTTVSVFAGVALLATAILVWAQAPSKDWLLRGLVSATCVGTLGGCAVFTVRGYRLEGRCLYVQRLLWDTRVSLDGLRETAADARAMRGSLRLFGNGGLFAIAGWFRSRRLGSYRAFATDPARAVVLTFPKRKIVVTPGDPEAFIRALESNHG